jgi:hypothetical protein
MHDAHELGLAEPPSAAPSGPLPTPRPCLGFLGVGWIGQHRLQAVVSSGPLEVIALAAGLAGFCQKPLDRTAAETRPKDTPYASHL